MAESTKPSLRTELTPHETLLMWIMPFSQVLSWAALIGTKVAGEGNSLWLFIVGAFYWLWALKNITMGPLKTDLGIVTYLTVLIPGAIGTFGTDSSGITTAQIVGSVLLFLNYGVAFAKFNKIPAENRYAKIGQRLNKTPQWAMIFFNYVRSSLLFWLTSIVLLALS